MMIMQPESVTQEIVDEAFKVVASKKDISSSLGKVKFQAIDEGKWEIKGSGNQGVRLLD